MVRVSDAAHGHDRVDALSIGNRPMERFPVVVEYRSFRNDDPPALVEIWNETFSGRGAAQLRHSSPLERHAFSKPYFDPAGLIVAVEKGVCVGFAHAGFGPNSTEAALSFTSGITCLIAVRPAQRRRGIGSELLSRCETYLRQRGARMLWAGPMRPLNPFYFGLYGGSDLPGFLASDAAAAPFLAARGYQPEDTCLVFQRRVDQALDVIDGRFPALRRRFEVKVEPAAGRRTWWYECTRGPVELIEFRLVETLTGQVAARTEVWEMDLFSWRWGLPAVGIVDLAVREDLRRQGLGKFLLALLLRYLQEQYFGVVEVQTMERNHAAVSLYHALGFEQVDLGGVYRLTKANG
jgi:ribosomal protein S18 acetylase RimI-like enzyme